MLFRYSRITLLIPPLSCCVIRDGFVEKQLLLLHGVLQNNIVDKWMLLHSALQGASVYTWLLLLVILPDDVLVFLNCRFIHFTMFLLVLVYWCLINHGIILSICFCNLSNLSFAHIIGQSGPIFFYIFCCSMVPIVLPNWLHANTYQNAFVKISHKT